MKPEKYKCLVVDDEPIARKILLNYIGQVPFLHLAAERINALSAIDYLRTQNDVNIIFLDVNMPHLSGLQLVKIVQPQQPVIFTTAYAEHAVESYELNAVDYLLKPFSFERFTKAVYKAVDVLTSHSRSTTEVAPAQRLIYIKSEGKNFPVYLDDILYCEARKNYTMIVLKNNQRLMSLISLSRFETHLAESGGEFLQVHRSFLVSKKHITSIATHAVTVNGVEIPLGIQFKERFFATMRLKDGRQ